MHVDAAEFMLCRPRGTDAPRPSSMYTWTQVWTSVGARPWEHFVPISHDMSDLEERTRWCIVEYPAKCAQIAVNAMHMLADLYRFQIDRGTRGRRLRLLPVSAVSAVQAPPRGQGRRMQQVRRGGWNSSGSRPLLEAIDDRIAAIEGAVIGQIVRHAKLDPACDAMSVLKRRGTDTSADSAWHRYDRAQVLEGCKKCRPDSRFKPQLRDV